MGARSSVQQSDDGGVASGAPVASNHELAAGSSGRPVGAGGRSLSMPSGRRARLGTGRSGTTAGDDDEHNADSDSSAADAVDLAQLLDARRLQRLLAAAGAGPSSRMGAGRPTRFVLSGHQRVGGRPLSLVPLFDMKCPVCHKHVPSDEVEAHLVMCMTRPRLAYNEDVLTEEKGECVICLDDMRAGDTIARLPCLCIYHKSCLDEWFKRKNTCPEHPGDE